MDKKQIYLIKCLFGNWSKTRIIFRTTIINLKNLQKKTYIAVIKGIDKQIYEIFYVNRRRSKKETRGSRRREKKEK